MTISAGETTIPVEHTDRFFIGGQWVTPSTDSKIDVIDSHTEQVYLSVAEAQAADMDRAITAAKEAFDRGPWPRLTHAERATYLRALGEEVVKRSPDIVQLWPREAGVIAAMAGGAAFGAQHTFNYYADLADTFQWERPVRPARGGFGLVVNGYLPDPAGPWGGVKSSGLGRELGPGAIAAYQNLKTVYASPLATLLMWDTKGPRKGPLYPASCVRGWQGPREARGGRGIGFGTSTGL